MVVSGLFLILFNGCQSAKSYDAKLYCDVVVEGYNGYGVASVNVNASSLGALYSSLTEEADVEKILRYDNLLDSIEYTLVGESESLSNDDEVKIKMEYDQELAKELRITFDNTEWEYVVSKLDDAQLIDPFEGLKLEYSGIAPNGEVSFNVLECNNFVRDHVKYSVDAGNLSNGTKFKVTARCEENILNQEKVILTQTQKEYEASGLGEYPVTLEGIDISDVYAEIFEYVDDNVSSPRKWKFGSYNNNWDNFSYKIEEQKIFYIVKKDNPKMNKLAFVFQVTASGDAPKNAYESMAKVIEVGESRVETAYYCQTSSSGIYVVDDKAMFDGEIVYSEYSLESYDNYETAKNAVMHISNSYEVIEVQVPEV